MSSSIESIFASVRDTYEAALPEEQRGIIKWLFGPRNVSFEGSPLSKPKVVLVAPSATYQPIARAGTAVSGTTETRTRYLRTTTLEWHVWGRDRATVEALTTSIVIVLRRVLGGSALSAPSERWTHDESPDATGAGAHAVLSVDVQHRITDDVIALPVTVVTDQGHDGLFAGESVC